MDATHAGLARDLVAHVNGHLADVQATQDALGQGRQVDRQTLRDFFDSFCGHEMTAAELSERVEALSPSDDRRTILESLEISKEVAHKIRIVLGVVLSPQGPGPGCPRTF
jgi:hypothetical protein